MSQIVLSHRESRVLSILAGIGNAIAPYLVSIRNGLNARDAYEHLSNMSESELAHRGLKREDIPALVMRRYMTGGK